VPRLIESALQRTSLSIVRFALVAPVTALLVACAPSIQLAQPGMALPAAFEAGRPVAAIQATAQPISLDGWWEDFHDPQLAGLIEQAFARSTTARLAYARIVEARAVRAQTRASTLPTGGISGNVTEQGTRALWGASVNQPGYTNGFIGFSPAWEVDLFGRLAKIRRQADLVDETATLDFYGTRLALAADVASNLYQARYLAAQLADAHDTLRIAQDLARSGALGEAHGLTSTQDAAQLDADAASAEALVAQLAANLQIAKRSLLILTGDPIALTTSLPITPALDAPPPVPDAAPGLLLARRPDVLSAEVALQSAALKVRIDRLALFPRFTISANAGLSATTSSPAALIFAGGTGVWSAAAGLMLPILDRTALMANLRISQAQGEEAVIGYETAVQTAYGEAENALTNVATDQLRTGQLDRATRSAKIAFDAARKGYAVGLTDLTTLLQVERSWLQDRSALNTARVALLADTVSAIRAFGGGWTPAPTANLAPPAAPKAGNL
jgi:multidrug efflux system outer membrane protein